MDILDKLIQERKLKRIKQDDICSKLGINSTTLSRYELRKREIPFNTVIKYAEALGMELKLQIKE